MCGISRIFHFSATAPVSRHALEQMSGVLRHRGPDGDGVYLGGCVGLANRRLAIIDRAQGRQPMANADESLWITYNGEIFNYQELRRTLELRGYRFRTVSDTEVVLQAYAAYGADCVTQLNGQFAFAIRHPAEQELFLARDRLGILPLHFAGRFLFASEAKGILAHPAVAAAAAILQRRKTHMPIPRAPSSVYRQVALTRDLLLGAQARSMRYFDRRQLADFLDRRNAFADVPVLAVWQISMYLITFELLYRAYRL